jgi:hypothetical protein
LKTYVGRVATGIITSNSEVNSNSIVWESGTNPSPAPVAAGDAPTGGGNVASPGGTTSATSNGYQSCGSGYQITN